jgi:copper resistance protein C
VRSRWHVHRARSAIIALLFAVAAIVLGAAIPASAHTALVGSDPRDGATLSSPPSAITLTFSEPVQTSFTQVAVLDSAGGRYESGQPQIDSARVIQPVIPLRNGSFQISYRVVSTDGHPVTGTLSFAVAAADSPAPTSADNSAPAAPGLEASASANPAPSDRSAAADSANSPERVNMARANAHSQAIPTWALVSAGVVVVVAALSAGAVLLARRRVQPIDNGGTRHTERENVYKER